MQPEQTKAPPTITIEGPEFNIEVPEGSSPDFIKNTFLKVKEHLASSSNPKKEQPSVNEDQFQNIKDIQQTNKNYLVDLNVSSNENAQTAYPLSEKLKQHYNQTTEGEQQQHRDYINSNPGTDQYNQIQQEKAEGQQHQKDLEEEAKNSPTGITGAVYTPVRNFAHAALGATTDIAKGLDRSLVEGVEALRPLAEKIGKTFNIPVRSKEDVLKQDQEVSNTFDDLKNKFPASKLKLEDVNSLNTLLGYAGDAAGGAAPLGTLLVANPVAAAAIDGISTNGNVYMDSIFQIAKDTGKKPSEVVDSPEGRKAALAAFGTGATNSALDLVTSHLLLNKINGLISQGAEKNAVRSTIDRIRSVAKGAASGALDMAGRSVANQAGSEIAANKPIDIDLEQVGKAALGGGLIGATTGGFRDEELNTLRNQKNELNLQEENSSATKEPNNATQEGIQPQNNIQQRGGINEELPSQGNTGNEQASQQSKGNETSGSNSLQRGAEIKEEITPEHVAQEIEQKYNDIHEKEIKEIISNKELSEEEKTQQLKNLAKEITQRENSEKEQLNKLTPEEFQKIYNPPHNENAIQESVASNEALNSGNPNSASNEAQEGGQGQNGSLPQASRYVQGNERGNENEAGYNQENGLNQPPQLGGLERIKRAPLPDDLQPSGDLVKTSKAFKDFVRKTGIDPFNQKLNDNPALVDLNPRDPDSIQIGIGSLIDDQFKILSPENILKGVQEGNINPNKLSDELDYFKQFISNKSGSPIQQNNEAFGEFYRAYLDNPEETSARAPELTRLFNDNVSDTIKEATKPLSDVLRSYERASSEQRMTSQTNTSNQNDIKEAENFAKLNIFEHIPEIVKPRLQYIVQQFIDGVSPIRKIQFAAETEAGKQLSNMQNVLHRYIYAMDSSKKILAFFQPKEEHAGWIDVNGNDHIDPVTGQKESFFTLMEPLLKNPEKFYDLQQKLQNLMIAERFVEFAKNIHESYLNGEITQEQYKEKLKESFSGVAEQKSSIKSKQPLLDEMKISKDIIEAHNQLAKENPEDHAAIEEAKRRYRLFADHILNYAVNSGLLSRESYKNIKDKNQYYVAMNRILEDHAKESAAYNKNYDQMFKRIAPGKVIKARKGSSAEINNLYTNIISYFNAVVVKGDKNLALQSLYNIFQDFGKRVYGGSKRVSEFGHIAPEEPASEDKGLVNVMIDGKPNYVRILDPELHDVLQNVNKLPGFGAPLIRQLVKYVNWTSLNTLSFVKNFITKDALQRVFLDPSIRLNAKEIANDYSSGIKNIFKLIDPIAYDFNKHGAFVEVPALGKFETRQDYRVELNKQINKWVEEHFKEKGVNNFFINSKKQLKEILPKTFDFLRYKELITRTAAYKSNLRRFKEMGWNDYDARLGAIYEMKELLNTATVGSAIKQLNAFYPFISARTAGMGAEIRAFNRNPTLFLKKALILDVLPAAAMMGYRQATFDKKDWLNYLEQPWFLRDNFVQYKIGPDNYFTMPQGEGIHSALTSLAKRVMEQNTGQDPYALQDWHRDFTNMAEQYLAASSGMPGVDAIYGLSTNYDPFKQKPIRPREEEGRYSELSPSNEYHSELANYIRKGTELAANKIGGSGLPAAYIDYTGQSIFGIYYRIPANILNINSHNVKPKGPLQILNVTKQGTGGNAASVQYLEDFIAKNGLNDRNTSPTLKGIVDAKNAAKELSLILNKTDDPQKREEYGTQIQNIVRTIRGMISNPKFARLIQLEQKLNLVDLPKIKRDVLNTQISTLNGEIDNNKSTKNIKESVSQALDDAKELTKENSK